MYLWIETLQTERVRPGDPVVLKFDNEFRRVVAQEIGGNTLGFVREDQPNGCADGAALHTDIGNRRVIASCEVILPNGVLLRSESPVLQDHVSYVRVEKAGYAFMVRQ